MPADELLNQAYDQLRQAAAMHLRAERPGQTLGATALVHEAWIKLASSTGNWNGRTHFVRVAASAMRQILVDRARARLTEKRGGDLKRVELPDVTAPFPDPQLLVIDEILKRLAENKPDHVRLIELRYFGGLTMEEAASELAISPSTADRMWRYAKAWLAVELRTEN